MREETRNSIKALTRVFYDYQEERKRLEGQLGITKDGIEKKKSPPKDANLLIELVDRRDEVAKAEETFKKAIAEEIHKHPLWNAFLKHVKGCGETMAAVIISEFDIHRGETVSKLWQFSGMNPGLVFGKKKVKGKIVVTETKIRGDKKTKGFLCPYNQFLKAKLLGVLGAGFLKANSEYRIYYDNMRKRLYDKDWGELSKNPQDKDKPKAGHQHNAARRYMVKMFLRDLYVAWRTLEGLPAREPYQEAYLGHKHRQAEEQDRQGEATA